MCAHPSATANHVSIGTWLNSDRRQQVASHTFCQDFTMFANFIKLPCAQLRFSSSSCWWRFSGIWKTLLVQMFRFNLLKVYQVVYFCATCTFSKSQIWYIQSEKNEQKTEVEETVLHNCSSLADASLRTFLLLNSLHFHFFSSILFFCHLYSELPFIQIPLLDLIGEKEEEAAFLKRIKHLKVIMPSEPSASSFIYQFHLTLMWHIQSSKWHWDYSLG